MSEDRYAVLRNQEPNAGQGEDYVTCTLWYASDGTVRGVQQSHPDSNDRTIASQRLLWSSTNRRAMAAIHYPFPEMTRALRAAIEFVHKYNLTEDAS